MNINNLPKEALKEFKELYFQKFGIKLTDQEAEDKSINFLEFLKLILLRDKKSMYNPDKGNS
jgi:hypothetical protein